MDTPLTLAFTLAALVGVAVVAWAAVRHLAGLQRTRTGGADLRLLQSRPVGGRTRLLVVGYRGHEYLLGVTAERVSVIDRLPAPAEAGADGPGAPSGDPDDGASPPVRRAGPDR